MYDNLKARLNAITLMELKEHWNISEVGRIVDFGSKCSEMAKELSNELNARLEGSDYEVSVSDFGGIEFKECIERSETGSMYKVLDTRYSEAHDLLPYEYVMGRKISKKKMEAVVREIEQRCELI